jgi:hypothetical protein
VAEFGMFIYGFEAPDRREFTREYTTSLYPELTAGGAVPCGWSVSGDEQLYVITAVGSHDTFVRCGELGRTRRWGVRFGHSLDAVFLPWPPDDKGGPRCHIPFNVEELSMAALAFRCSSRQHTYRDHDIEMCPIDGLPLEPMPGV